VAVDGGGRGARRTLTVIVPALNEAAALPALLDSLRRQTVRPDAVIVADAHSTDNTREVAAAHGAEVVDGGMPGVGRNAGARAADTDLLLFLDADVALTDGAIATMLEEFDRRALVVAGAQIRPIERDPRYVFACEVVNFYLEMMQYVEPHAPGCCILVTREVHNAIGGFDEALALAEDHDYVERAAQHGRFRILRRAHVRTSMRRLAKEGLVSLAFKYLYCELQVVTGQKILTAPFDYEFAAFAAPDEAPTRRGLSKLRERVMTLTDTIRQVSSEGRDALREVGDTEIDFALMERSLARLRTDDVRALERYVKVRARLVRRGSRRAVSRVRRMADAVRRELRR
jgi:glycosyltransferase involved in cell wall biosynthesis